MPLPCYSIDGPVACAATKAIHNMNPLYVLPWVPQESEDELCAAFEDVMHAREKHPDAEKVADRWFIETAVRLHLQGQGKPFMGLRPADSSRSPAVTVAERAMESGDVAELADLLREHVEFSLEWSMDRVKATASFDPRVTAEARRHVCAVHDFLQLADDMYSSVSDMHTRREHAEQRAEACAKWMLGQPFRERHPATVEALLSHR